MFPTIGCCAKQILGRVVCQIKSEILFSLVGIITSLRRCRLQSKNLENLIFVNKNWPNDPRIGCKSPSSWVKFIENDLYYFLNVWGVWRSFWKGWNSGVVNFDFFPNFLYFKINFKVKIFFN